MNKQVRRGFALGDNAARAAKKNHELGTAHRFTSETARDAGRRGLERRRQNDPTWGRRRVERRRTNS